MKVWRHKKLLFKKENTLRKMGNEYLYVRLIRKAFRVFTSYSLLIKS